MPLVIGQQQPRVNKKRAIAQTGQRYEKLPSHTELPIQRIRSLSRSTCMSGCETVKLVQCLPEMNEHHIYPMKFGSQRPTCGVFPHIAVCGSSFFGLNPPLPLSSFSSSALRRSPPPLNPAHSSHTQLISRTSSPNAPLIQLIPALGGGFLLCGKHTGHSLLKELQRPWAPLRVQRLLAWQAQCNTQSLLAA